MLREPWVFARVCRVECRVRNCFFVGEARLVQALSAGHTHKRVLSETVLCDLGIALLSHGLGESLANHIRVVGQGLGGSRSTGNRGERDTRKLGVPVRVRNIPAKLGGLGQLGLGRVAKRETRRVGALRLCKSATQRGINAHIVAQRFLGHKRASTT